MIDLLYDDFYGFGRLSSILIYVVLFAYYLFLSRHHTNRIFMSILLVIFNIGIYEWTWNTTAQIFIFNTENNLWTILSTIFYMMFNNYMIMGVLGVFALSSVVKMTVVFDKWFRTFLFLFIIVRIVWIIAPFPHIDSGSLYFPQTFPPHTVGIIIRNDIIRYLNILDKLFLTIAVASVVIFKRGS